MLGFGTEGFNVTLGTMYISSVTIFPTSHIDCMGLKAVFLTNHLAIEVYNRVTTPET